MKTFILLAMTAALAAAQSPHDAGAVRAGKASFLKMCSGCHGANATGGRGPTLASGEWKSGGSDEDLVRNITVGIAGTAMPPFPIGEGEARQIIAYLRSLSATEGEKASGDASKGRGLFFGAAGCSRCHMMQGRGGRLGPDLTGIRQERNPAALRKAITDPSESQRPYFQAIEVTLNSGKVIRGARKNEDTFSVQLMDAAERLHMLSKSEVKSVTRLRESLMPAVKLATGDLENLVAFLDNPGPAPEPGEWKPAADLNITFNRLKNAGAEPRNWLTYWGNYEGTHYSNLTQINTANVPSLRGVWTHQYGAGRNQSTPIVVDGLMFVTGPGNDVAALDARTGKPIWRYHRRLPDDVHSFCTVMTNRGVAILGDRLFMATLDAHLVALDAKTGNVIYDIAVDDYKTGYTITHMPLALDGKIIVGVTAGECGNNGFLDAFDAATGKKLWRFDTIPKKGDPARATWSGNSADTGGGPTWMTGTYDVETDTLFWTTGNPSPDYEGESRLGDNLYTCSVLALDPSTGKLKWHFQFTPHDVHDWDANEAPVLVNTVFRGQKRKVLIQANRNAFYYVLDRTTGQFLTGKAFAKQTWAKGLDDAGRPIVLPNTDPTPEGNYVCPDAAGAANWAAPSYDPKTNLFFVPTREACAWYTAKRKTPIAGQPYTGSGQREDPIVANPGAVKAIDPATGNIKWEFKLQVGNVAAGVLGTAGGLVFAASADGYLVALDARTGKALWKYQTGAEMRNSPISYAIDGKQYIAVGSDSALFTFALP